MANIKNLTKRLNAVDKDRGYFTIEDIVFALEVAGDSWMEELHRKYPFKTFHPQLIQLALEAKSPEGRSE